MDDDFPSEEYMDAYAEDIYENKRKSMYSQQGQVTQVTTKPFTDKFGKNVTLYSFQLHGDPRWYRTGKFAPACSVGDNISFVFEQVGNNCNVQAQSIQGGSAAAPSAPAVALAPPAASAPANKNFQARKPAGGSTKDDYWANKDVYDKEVTQPRIAYAAAQKSAVEIVGFALQHDILSLGNKKGEKLDLVLDIVDEITGKLALKLHSAHEILADLQKSAVAAVSNAQVVLGAEDTEDNMYGDE